MSQPALQAFWHPIAAVDDITEQPRRFTLLDDYIVAFRDERGVAAFRDLCIHRGAALSLGWVRNGALVCPYHGWQYDRSGACIRIPARPAESSIPTSARAQAYRVQEKYGLVWVAMDEPRDDVPLFPNDIYDLPGWKSFVSYREVWNTSAARAVENFMDFSHFPYVHDGLLGTEDNAEIAPYTVEKLANGLHYWLEQEEPSDLYGAGGSQKVRYEYTLVVPFTIHLKKIEIGTGRETIITQFTLPRTETSTELFVVIVRNHSHDEPDSTFGDFTATIMEQDRRIVESQRPEKLPDSLREELHIKVPDAASLLYRQRLSALAKVEAFGPYGA
ncbi:phenylpropionate dioxygenase-like ring-hydroxylating dioxygenase large terminal subunit [Mycolicibacterium iranicum]|uniref:Phenylpropionate dioxygenase-like ring-hydroxylating dioxygenase large terminal subunit n=1 Tax=Mycolicibacterium iranicum TaxID=912594 RepID=A0A839Q7V4_MYCIR|nr:aromatic ring-hydroxylating dioxygenase subunit alpha [Mycolicibacterium iranicum]MBB2990306.1 phenylpropionate dioxygenase-like ring-hydroxylating dioxygenase large terminal subunit [Mycolicibacterium iranicum]